MRFQKITPFLAVVFILALVLSACSAVDLAGVSASGRQSRKENNGSLMNGLTLGQTRFTGSVVSIDTDRITVDDLVFRVDDNSKLPGKLSVGDVVNVDGLLLPDQSRYVVSLGIQMDSSADDSSSVEFKLYGQVEGMGDESWVVSGEVIYVDSSTQISQSIDLTDLVEVEGNVLNGNLVAKKISLEDSLPGGVSSLTTTPSTNSNPSASGTVTAGLQVEFFGVLESMNGDSWVVDGKSLTILPQTEIKGQLLVGDFVKVHAWRQLDGSLIAREIEIDDDSDDDQNDDDELKGIITAMNGNIWVIGGVTVLLDASTELSSNLQIGDFVKVEGTMQSDGSILAREVKMDDDSSDDMDDDSSDDMDDDSSDDMDDDSSDDMDDDSDDDMDDDSDDDMDDDSDDDDDDDDELDVN